MRVYIAVSSQGQVPFSEARTVHWEGDIDWPSVPPEGATWAHCGGWAGERVGQVFYIGPTDPKEAPVSLEVDTDNEVIQHLIDEHDFQEG